MSGNRRVARVGLWLASSPLGRPAQLGTDAVLFPVKFDASQADGREGCLTSGRLTPRHGNVSLHIGVKQRDHVRMPNRRLVAVNSRETAPPTRRPRIRRPFWFVAIASTLMFGAAACAPAPKPVRYVDKLFASVDTTFDRHYATAPDLQSGQAKRLHLDVVRPRGDRNTKRPTIVWIHGGGFKSGDKSVFRPIAQEWAKRGYVTATINYRLDPGNRCQDVQRGVIKDKGILAAEAARCQKAMVAAQHDAQAAIRWLRANASAYGLDPTKIAVGGGSAGAITAINVAQRSHDPGKVGNHLSQPSRVRAALAASGCQYQLGDVDSKDAPVSLLASEFDKALPFSCVRSTERAIKSAGGTVQTKYYLGEGTHARRLYLKYVDDVDRAWAAFLVKHLGL